MYSMHSSRRYSNFAGCSSSPIRRRSSNPAPSVTSATLRIAAARINASTPQNRRLHAAPSAAAPGAAAAVGNGKGGVRSVNPQSVATAAAAPGVAAAVGNVKGGTFPQQELALRMQQQRPLSAQKEQRNEQHEFSHQGGRPPACMCFCCCQETAASDAATLCADMKERSACKEGSKQSQADDLPAQKETIRDGKGCRCSAAHHHLNLQEAAGGAAACSDLGAAALPPPLLGVCSTLAAAAASAGSGCRSADPNSAAANTQRCNDDTLSVKAKQLQTPLRLQSQARHERNALQDLPSRCCSSRPCSAPVACSGPQEEGERQQQQSYPFAFVPRHACATERRLLQHAKQQQPTAHQHVLRKQHRCAWELRQPSGVPPLGCLDTSPGHPALLTLLEHMHAGGQKQQQVVDLPPKGGEKSAAKEKAAGVPLMPAAPALQWPHEPRIATNRQLREAAGEEVP
ncbi:hypothetical protein cyc_05909 [Cyclospora cayetanensis]|uniref:Uncharacterized protein n=1 Tax=Cyclospora cayetanensis TaxID=88456 RepID=A0A1D3D793_9EIME|nr:hypothetical protein cyc_05909 [Cyclospora cayetanensis]